MLHQLVTRLRQGYRQSLELSKTKSLGLRNALPGVFENRIQKNKIKRNKKIDQKDNMINETFAC
jgi:hypothetical protein